MQSQVCPVCRKAERASASQPARPRPYRSCCPLQALMGLRRAEGSWWSQQKAAGGPEATRFVVVIPPAKGDTTTDRAEVRSMARSCQGRVTPSPSPSCSPGTASSGTHRQPGHTALHRTVTAVEHVELSLKDGQEASLVMEKTLGNVGTL